MLRECHAAPTYMLAAVGVLATGACSGSTKADAATQDNAALAAPIATPATAACGGTDAPEVRRAIEPAYARAEAGIQRGDPEALWALYADDAIYMWDNQRQRRRSSRSVSGAFARTPCRRSTARTSPVRGDAVLPCGDVMA